MKPTIRPIETEYLGYRFRSRLESRWAHVLQSIGLSFTYEPEGFEFESGGEVSRYLPDFWVKDWQTWLEIKPDTPNEREIKLAELLGDASGRSVIIFAGTPGDHRSARYECGVWSRVNLAQCGLCGGVGFDGACCGSPRALTVTLRRAYEDARSCRFERLPRNLRRALEVA